MDDWQSRIGRMLPRLRNRILVCTYGYLTRHYAEYDGRHFDYVVVDEL